MGAEFIAEEGVLKGLILSLAKGEEWTFGRDPNLSTIVLEDPEVSRAHMKVRKTEVGYIVESLDENNPVLVDGQPVDEPIVLHEEALVTIGDSVFRFYEEGPQGTMGLIEEHSLEKPSFEPLETEEEVVFEEPFSEEEVPQLDIDLTQTTRFILKVIAGPNTGAEFALDLDKSYLIGTDTASCDIVFNDLSVSREHARLTLSADGQVLIEDLNSRNGVVVDKERLAGSVPLAANAVVALGTSAFLLIDREAPSETIAASVLEAPPVEEEEVLIAAKEPLVAGVGPELTKKRPFSTGTFVLALMVCGLVIMLGIGLISLFQTKEIERVQKDYLAELQAAVKDFPTVRFTFNPLTHKLLLVGHVDTGIKHNELLYRIRGLSFVKGIDDNIVDDEAVWQEMNILLSQHADFKGVSMHSPEPGVFVVNGYLQTEKQAADLTDYLNIHFNYLNLLQNRVVVEQSVIEEVTSRLVQLGYGAVNAALTNGDLQLTGYVSSNQLYDFDKQIEEFKKIPGIRFVRNFVVTVTPEQGVVDLNRKLKYRVTGYSKHGDVNLNVVINGRILTRGDVLDGYTVTSIQPNTIFLEREGLKYKIEYNKQGSSCTGG